MRPVLLIFLFSLPMLTAPPEPVRQITFKAVTAFGEPVAAHVASLGDPLHQRDLTARCAGLICTDIPEGPYRFSLSIETTGRKVEGTAVVYRANQIVVVDVGTPNADTDESSFPTIVGRVVNAPDTSKVWIRLQQLYSDMSISAGVERDGSFKLDEVRPGNWMLLIFVEGKLVHFQPFICQEKNNPPLRLNLHNSEPLLQVKTPARNAPEPRDRRDSAAALISLRSERSVS